MQLVPKVFVLLRHAGIGGARIIVGSGLCRFISTLWIRAIFYDQF